MKKRMIWCVLIAVLLAIGFGGCQKECEPVLTYTLDVNVNPEEGGKVFVCPNGEARERAYVSGALVKIEAVPAQGYDFYYWNGDITDTSAVIYVEMDSNKSVIACFKLKDPIPPVISEVKIEKITDRSAVITWITDEPARGLLECGTTPECDYKCLFERNLVTEHKFKLTGLEPGATYYFRAKSADESENWAASAEYTFRTDYEIPFGYEVGKRAPDFTLPSYQDDNPESPNKGQTISLSDFKGKKTVLNLWTTYCGACMGEFPIIREWYYSDECKENTGSVAVITVDINGRADRIKILEEKYFDEVGHYTFPILLDKDGLIGKSYHVWTTPMTFFIDSDGIIRGVKLGRFWISEEMEEMLKLLD